MRRADRAAGQDDAAPRRDALDGVALLELDPGRALAVEQHVARLGVHDDLQVGSLAGRCQVGARGALAEAAAPGHLDVADAAGMAAVDVLAALEPDLGAGLG